MPFDPNKITLYVQEGESLIALGKATFDQIRTLWTAGSDADDDAALAKLDALYAARIAQAQKDAGVP